MSQTITSAGKARLNRLMGSSGRRPVRLGAVVLAVLVACGVAAAWYRARRGGSGESEVPERPKAAAAARLAAGSGSVHFTAEQQRAVGLKTARTTLGASFDVLIAPGRVAPNEARYAFITPRAAGVVRSVTAHVGQDVKAGDLLATIDSPEVGAARLDLYTKLQALDVARAQAAWQERIYATTLELLERLRKGETPEQIHNALADRPAGENREKLMTAYAQYRLAVATIGRNRELYAQRLITPKQFEQVNADFEVAQATYQSLMDQMGYENQLANVRAQQAMRNVQTSVRAARERLRILGVKPDGTEPEVAGGKVVGVESNGTLVTPGKAEAPESEKPDTILPPPRGSKTVVEPPGAHPGAVASSKDAPVSTYSIWAPFDGTILDREMIVPGVAVDTTHRIFTMANLETVWVEANVHESDFDRLAHSGERRVRFRSAAYPGRTFDGEVVYAGDLVEEKSRALKLLASAKNPGRLLKPGMFVEVEVLTPAEASAVTVPASALLTEGSRSYVYVRSGPERFDRREVAAEPPRGGSVVIRSGLHGGEDVVVEGAYTLKSMAIQLASTGK